MPINKDNYMKADLYVCVGESSKDLAVGGRFLAFLTVFTHNSNSAELWKINPIFVTEGE